MAVYNIRTLRERRRLVALLLEIKSLDRGEYDRLMGEMRSAVKKAKAN